MCDSLSNSANCRCVEVEGWIIGLWPAITFTLRHMFATTTIPQQMINNHHLRTGRESSWSLVGSVNMGNSDLALQSTCSQCMGFSGDQLGTQGFMHETLHQIMHNEFWGYALPNLQVPQGPRSIAEMVWSRKWGFCPDAISWFLSGLYPAYLKIRKFVQVGESGGFSAKICPDLQI